jgi:hypothetical protein
MARPQRQDLTAKLTEAHDRLTQAVSDLVSGDDWQTFLALAAKLRGYSARNVLLILSQAPWATQLAGYRTWKQIGRQVRAGEKGIAILAPCRYRTSTDDADPADPPPTAKPATMAVTSSSEDSASFTCSTSANRRRHHGAAGPPRAPPR